jgi:hypothetical protein
MLDAVEFAATLSVPDVVEAAVQAGKRRHRPASRRHERRTVHDVGRAAKEATPAWPMIASMAASTLLLGVMEMIFIAASPAILAATPPTPVSLVVPWVRGSVIERDGIETQVVSPGLLLFLVATVGITFALRKISKPVALALAVAGAGAATVIVARTRSTEFVPLAETSSRVLLCVVISLLIWVWHATYVRASPVVRRIAVAAGVILFAAVVVLSLSPPSLFDYGFFIGPGLKLEQGEPLGRFYMQYSLLETLVFTAMMVVGLKAHLMAVVLSVLFVGWYGIYWLIAKRLFRDRFIAWLCMAALVVTRFLAIRDHPVAVPQVLPLRLDLWAPLLLAVIVWGLASWRTSLAFGGAYVLDSTFGAMFAAVYAGALSVSWWWSGDRKAGLRRTLLLLLPVAGAGVFQRWVFGAWVSGAASQYLGVQIGFLPISATSLFFPITMLVGWAAVVFASRETERTARLGLLLCAFAAVQFVYFIGRSHDHNLLNISGVWLFAIFLAVDQTMAMGRARVFIAAGLVVALTVMSTEQFLPKFERINDKLRRGVWVDPLAADRALDASRGELDATTILVDQVDAYVNYRLGLRQRGFYAPFAARLFLDDTAGWMEEQIRRGMHIRSSDPRWPHWVEEFNDTPVMKERGRQFAVIREGPLLEIVTETTGR